jgi:hypothetical protein
VLFDSTLALEKMVIISGVGEESKTREEIKLTSMIQAGTSVLTRGSGKKNQRKS